MACAGSQFPEKGEIVARTGDDGPARLGSCVHRILQDVVVLDLDDLPGSWESHAQEYAIENREELAMLVRFGIQAWREIKAHFPTPMTELHMTEDSRADGDDPDDLALTGHIDAASLITDRPEANILDWKSGRVDSSYFDQVAGYAYLMMVEHPHLEKVSATVVWLRERAFQTYSFDKARLTEWITGVHQRILRWDGTYHVGEQCRYCPRSAACPARRQMVVRTVADLDRGGFVPGAIIPAAAVVDLYHRVKVVAKAAEDFIDWLRMQIATQGPQAGAEGTTLILGERTKRKIKPLEAWPVLDARMTRQELAACIKISKTAVEETVANKAAKGMKGKDKKAVLAELEAAGAIEIVLEPYLREVKDGDPALIEKKEE
jgi:hypothetical protein